MWTFTDIRTTRESPLSSVYRVYGYAQIHFLLEVCKGYVKDELTSGIDLVVSIVKLIVYGVTSFISSIISFILLVEDKTVKIKKTEQFFNCHFFHS